MRRFLFINTVALVAIGSVAQVSASAAEMRVTKPQKKGDFYVIFIDGDIEKGDFEKFKKLAIANNLPAGKVIVSLQSRGGFMGEAADMGTAIRGMKWWTVAREHCASACSDIWLAGVRRGVYQETALGFHSVYITTKDGKTEVDSSGNAIVGAYYSKLGLSYEAISYLTSAKPDEMEWLDPEKAKKYNIAFEYLGSMPGAKNQSPPEKKVEAAPTPEYSYQCPQDPRCGPSKIEQAKSNDQFEHFSIGIGPFRISFGFGGGGGRRYVAAPRRHVSAPHRSAPSREASRPSKSSPSTSTSSSGGWSAVKGNS
jgi:hypothetical protein